MASRKDVLMTVASWTDEEKHVAITQIARLAAVPAEAADLFAEEIAPKPKPRRRKH
jgi:hypothetical protein